MKSTSKPLRTVSSQRGTGARAGATVRNQGKATGGKGAILLPGSSKTATQTKTGR